MSTKNTAALKQKRARIAAHKFLGLVGLQSQTPEEADVYTEAMLHFMDWLAKSETGKQILASCFSERRKTFAPGTGAPRSDKPRCPCDKNTLKRAKSLCFRCCREAGIAAEQISAAKSSFNY